MPTPRDPHEPLARLADPQALRAHQSRFDLARLSRDGLSALDARRLDVLLDRPYEDLSEREIVHALDLTARSDAAGSWFAFFLPATLRRSPTRDPRASERFVAGMLASRHDAAVADWDAEIDATLDRWLATRPLRGGDDPVELWLSQKAARSFEIDAARRNPARTGFRPGAALAWMEAPEGPLYPRLALLRFLRFPARAAAQLAAWEKSSADNAARLWVETMFHGHGVGWRVQAPGFAEFLEGPERAVWAEALLSHERDDVAIGAAAVLRLLSPSRAEIARERFANRVAALDDAVADRFVLTPAVRRLVLGS